MLARRQCFAPPAHLLQPARSIEHSEALIETAGARKRARAIGGHQSLVRCAVPRSAYSLSEWGVAMQRAELSTSAVSGAKQVASGAIVDNLRTVATRRTHLFVLAGWILLSLAALDHVRRFALQVPFADEWHQIDVVTGRATPSLTWYWSLLSEHRMPVPKLIYLVMGNLTDYHFESMALLNVAVLSVASAVWLIAMQRARGSSELVDLMGPAALLHFGHEINLTWCFQINFVLASVLAVASLLIVALARQPLRLGTALGLSMILVIAAGCGTFGLLYVPPLALWIGLCGAWQWHRGGEPRSQSLGLLLLAALLVAMVAAYVAAFPRGLGSPLRSPSIWQTLLGATRFNTTGLGPIGRGLKPLTAWLMLGLLAGAGCWLAREWRHGRTSRMTLIGLALFIAAGLLLALGVAHARAGGGWRDLYQSRYGILAAPLLCALLLIWERLAPHRIRQRFVAIAVLLMPVLVICNDVKGLRDARRRHAVFNDVVAAAQQNRPLPEISARWSGELQCPPAELQRHLADLRARGLSPYRFAQISDQRTAQRPAAAAVR